MIKAIKAWWRTFRRDCVRTSLLRHHGWGGLEITEQVLDDVEAIIWNVEALPSKVTTTELIATYRLNRDVELIFTAVDWLMERGVLVTREMIFWAIRNGKV